MNVLSVCPLRVASLEWRTGQGVCVLTVVAKATYRLAPVACTLAAEQDDPNEYESHWDYDPQHSLHSPSDLVPYKPRPEVTLVGQAFAPRGEPAARLLVRLVVGTVDKTIAVHAPRSFAQDGVLRHGARFTRMPLRYERAAGGPETTNPVGVTRSTDTFGVMALPNLEPPTLNVTRPGDFIEPVGFGPIAADWPTRRARLGRHLGPWTASVLQTTPLPDGIDHLFFNSAPADQLLDDLRPNERLVLEHLHPEYPHLVTSLPGHEPRAFVERPGSPVVELPMTCDTLWIDTDRSVCTLTWRGQLTLERAGQDGRVVVASEMMGRPLPWSAVEGQVSSGAPVNLEETQPRPPSRPHRTSTATHQPRGEMPSWPSWLASGEAGPTPAPGDVRLDTLAGGRTGTVDVAVPKDVIESAIARADAARARYALPSLAAPAARPPGSVQPAPATPWAPAAATVSVPSIHLPPAPVAPAPTIAPIRLPPVTPPPAAVPSRPAPAPSGLRSFPEPPKGGPPADAGPAAADLRRATERGAAAASNAAAASARASAPPADAPTGDHAPPAAAREPAREHVDLLWFEPDAVARILADEVLGEARPERPGAKWVKEAPTSREPQEARDRRAILAVTSRVRPIDEPATFDQIAGAAYRDDGTYAAPLVLVAGEISFTFDEVDVLRTLIVVTSPFRAADKKLREVVDGAAETLKAEGRLAGDVAAGLNRRIEEAFAQGPRSVAPGYLETSVERILLEDRRYPRRTLFGEPRLRALLTFPGGSAPVPTYLPETLATRLPLFRRFRARAVVELRPQEDQYETHASALLALALGRVIRRAG